MSTFNGLLAEFPDIRVDFFRNHPNRKPPLACFLSHVHTDHLAGLDTLRSPFVYCSAATREILLRLETVSRRINYAQGILEARQLSYKHLRNLLKPLPLDTPVELELEPGNYIQVTLLDANHCPGAAMFLFEGQGKAALYTGDIRSEPWHVNAIARSPSMVQYAYGLKTLDTIYLDTSFIEDIEFPTKAQGISELLDKVSRYPPNTIFHFQAWTYGYEDVWIALSKALESRVHVDEYKMGIYQSLLAKDPGNKRGFGALHHLSPEAPALVGFMRGNSYHPGCLTLDENVRLHSCEKGNYCKTVRENPIVQIQPVLTHLRNGEDLPELGIGGGGDDLEHDEEQEHLSEVQIQMVTKFIHWLEKSAEKVELLPLESFASGSKIEIGLELLTSGANNKAALLNFLQDLINKSKSQIALERSMLAAHSAAEGNLPSLITFPYSRHSSYAELCHLVDTCKPKDVWPNTVNPREWLEQGITIEHLFGTHCSGNSFRHDKLIEEIFGMREQPILISDDSQSTASHPASSCHTPSSPTPQVADNWDGTTIAPNLNLESSFSQISVQSEASFDMRTHVFHLMLDNAINNAGHDIGLISTRDHHTNMEVELGEI
ncbi:beta-lactamase-like protein [Neurospora intermedia]|uniref:Protein artemis n=1 Tax=Neurospora intermedia TaxID=5142 RepID=A0ABR3D4P7_NEUIN